MSMVFSENPLPDLADSRELITDDILTQKERKKLYRQKLRDHQEGRSLRLKQFVLGKRRHLRLVDMLPRRKRVEDTDMMCRYFNGDQYGKWNDLGLYEDQRQDGDFAYTLPVLAGHTEQAFIQMLKVKPQYEWSADDKEDATMGLVARMCEDLGTKELTRCMNPRVPTELYNLLWAGESKRIVGWAPNPVKPRTVERLKYKSVSIELPARRECANCKAVVGTDAATCPECQSSEFTDIPGGVARQKVEDGTEEVALGENTIYIPHMLSMQRDMSALEPEDSTFEVEYGYMDKHVAEWTYQSEIEPTTLPMPVEMSLRYDLERSSTQLDAYIGSSRLASPGREGFTTGMSVMPNYKQPHERHYWDASEYGQFLITVKETLPNGDVIPADTLLGDYAPDGLKLLIVGDTIMEFERYVRRRKQSLIRYGRIAGTNSGAGLKKAMPLQDALNDNFNLTQTIKHTVGHPLTVIDGHYIDKLPSAGNVLKITRAGITDIGTVVKQFAGQPVNDSDRIDQVIQSAMQFILGTNTVGGNGVAGAPDMRAAATATGIAAMQEQAAARQSGPVDERTRCDMETMVQLLENIQEYSSEEQKAELSKRFGTDTAKAFFNCNLRQHFTVGIKTGTDMPRSMALDQANYIAFGQVASTILPVAEQYPWVMEFLGDLATAMGFPFNVGQGRNDRREAQYRLNLLIDIEAALMQTNPSVSENAVEMAADMHAELEKVVNPLMMDDDAAQDPNMPPSEAGAPRVLMQDHDAFMDVYKDAIFSEQAKSWSQAHRLVVIQLFLDHYKAKASKQIVEAQLMATLQAKLAPPAPPEAPDNSPTAEEQAALEDQRFTNEAAMNAAKHESERQHKDEDLGRGMVDREHETEQEARLAQQESEQQAAQAQQANEQAMQLATHQAAVAPRPAPTAR